MKDKIVTKTIQYKATFYTFFLKKRVILNQSEFSRLEKDIRSGVLSYCRTKYWTIPGFALEDLYQHALMTLNACIYTYNNAETARTTKRAKFNTYFWSILKNEVRNRYAVQSQNRTINNLREKGKDLQADLVYNLRHPVSLDEMSEAISFDVVAARLPVSPSAEDQYFTEQDRINEDPNE